MTIKRSVGFERILLGSLLAIGLFGSGEERAAAQDDQHFIQQVIQYLEGSEAAKALQNVNFAPAKSGIKTGYIANGADHFQDAFYHLDRGYAYAFVGKCDEDCRQLTFELFDPTGEKIGVNETSGDTPIIWLLVTQSGDYRVRARMPNCGGFFGCYWGVEPLTK
jgi:hypothetical protein